MLDGKASRTARMVSLARALSRNERGAPLDPYAERFLPSPIRQAATWLDGHGIARRVGILAASAMTGGLVDHITLRTQTIDSETAAATVRGTEQLVILGAGFDMRAWRLLHLSQTKIFEIDHPATQDDKRAHLGPLLPKSTFVAVDFEKNGFAPALLAAGFDPTKPSTWIWEGVVPYLNEAAVEATLDAIATLAAPSSTLIISYAAPLQVSGVLEETIRRGFSLIGEPLRFFQTPNEMAARLTSRGFVVERDSNSAVWASPHQRSIALRALAFASERIVVARAHH